MPLIAPHRGHLIAGLTRNLLLYQHGVCPLDDDSVSNDSHLLLSHFRAGRATTNRCSVRHSLQPYRVIAKDSLFNHLMLFQIFVQILEDFFAQRIPCLLKT